VFKVTAYDAGDGTARLTLPSGGVVTLPIERVERVLQDEVVPEPEAPVVAAEAPALALAFDHSQAIPEVPYGTVLYAAARRHGLNPALLAAVVRAESAFEAGAVSYKGACGLMQLMPATGKRFGLARQDLFDVEKNVDAGARYLAFLVQRFGQDLPTVLAAYNAGEGTVDRYRGVPPYRETRNYIRRIYESLGLEIA
jgi:soluble lytic murein transglycosylase-like protein